MKEYKKVYCPYCGTDNTGMDSEYFGCWACGRGSKEWVEEYGDKYPVIFDRKTGERKK